MNRPSAGAAAVAQLYLPAFLPALGAYIAVLALSAFTVDVTLAAESRYLGLLMVAILLPLAALSRPPALPLHALTIAAPAALWMIPIGGTRGAVLSLLLLTGLAVCSGRRWRQGQRTLATHEVIALFLGSQLLLRSDLLIDPTFDWKTWGILFGLPVIAALGFVRSARIFGSSRAVLSAALLLAFSAGWTPSAALTLLGLSLVPLAETDRRRGMISWLSVALLVLLLGVSSPAAGLLLLTSAAVLRWGEDWRPGLLAIGPLLATTLFLATRENWQAALPSLAWLPLLLPLLATAYRRAFGFALMAFLAALCGLALADTTVALAAPLSLLTLRFSTDKVSRTLQNAWALALLLGTHLVGAYPWLRSEPLTAFLRLFSLAPDWGHALLVSAVTLAAAWAARRNAFLQANSKALAVGLILGVLFLSQLASLPTGALRPLTGEILTLNSERPLWSSGDSAASAISTVVLDSHLSGSIDLPRGAPVGKLRLRFADGGQREWVLRAGIHTATWKPPTPASLLDQQAQELPPWISWVAPGRIFARRYRANDTLEQPATVEGIELERHSSLPQDMSWTIYHLELRW